MRFINITTLLVSLILLLSCGQKSKKIELVVTTDVHGKIFSYDYANDKPSENSLSKVSFLVDSLRKENKQLFIFDCGDLLQGTPAIYHQNYLQNTENHPIVAIMKHIGYSASVVGNHDIECGPEIYNSLNEQFNHPWLGANIVNIKTGKPHFKPYTIIKDNGHKIAILGLITPGIPGWLPAKLWKDLEFEDMVESASTWMATIKKEENPDFIIGLFHSGWNSTYGGVDSLSVKNENASLTVAHEVDGFNLIFIGHDHDRRVFDIQNKNNNRVVIVDGGSHARTVGRVTLNVSAQNDLTVDTAWVENISKLSNSSTYDSVFANEGDKIKTWINSPVCTIDESINCNDALVAPSTYMNLIHEIQLAATNADISFATPVSIYNRTSSDTLRESDLFKLYSFENKLYTLKMTGKEIRSYLEYSVHLWFNNDFPNSTLLQYQDKSKSNKLSRPYYNFASAGGVKYNIDFRRKPGDRIYGIKLNSGENLLPNKNYLVAVNSYQANGGGGHLEIGAGIPKQEIERRTVSISEEEVRTIMRSYLFNQKEYRVNKTQNWTLHPSSLWKESAEKELNEFFNKSY
ncbi:MAG: bifunctional metallophosphatase/5'-nucleotidase [Salinivirgaceae bacterium]|nr:bifunctional metallophosphatase/5'-nucleotidase [Salinivirgaceae bacterium]